MTVTTTVNVSVSEGNGVATSFDFGFLVVEESHLVVTRRVRATGVVDKTYILDTEYTITGLGDPGGGSITLLGGPLGSTYDIVITRIVPYTQELDIINNSGFYPDTVETQLDLIVMQTQQLADGLGRSIKVGEGDSLETLVSAEGRKNKIVGFDSTGEIMLYDANEIGLTLDGTISGSATGIFFDTDAGDLFTELDNEVSGTLTVSDTSLAFSSAGAVAIESVVKDADGNVGLFCFDTYTVDIDVTVTSYPVSDSPGLYAGAIGIPTSLGLHALSLGSSGSGAGYSLGTMYNAGSPLTIGAENFSFASPFEARVQYTATGNSITGTVTFPSTPDDVIPLTQVFDATSYEMPRLFFNLGVRFARGVMEVTRMRVSAAYPNAAYAIVGDSLTQGRFADDYTEGYAYKLRLAYPENVIIAGAPSSTTEDWLEALTPVLSMQPAYIVLALGINDIATSRPLVDIQADYTTLVTRIEAAGIIPICVAVSPFGHASVPTFNAWLSTQGWAYVDIYTPLLGSGVSINAAYDSGDGLHWNSAGHAVVYATILAELESNTALPEGTTYRVDTDPLMTADRDNYLPSQSAVIDYVGLQRTRGISPLGYSSTVRGSVTQLTNKSTGVSLNALTGEITMHNAALASDTSVMFTLTNTNVEEEDVLIVNHVSGGTLGAYTITPQCKNGTVDITVRNITTGSLGEAIVLRYALVRG